MSQNLQTLNTVLDNIKQNRAAVAAQIVASTKALGNPSPEVLAAIDTLIAEHGSNVQVIGQVIGAKLQIEQLEKTAVEINALVASLEVMVDDPEAESKITRQMSADLIRSAAAVNSGSANDPTGALVSA